MKTQRRNDSEDPCLTITRRNTRPKTSVNRIDDGLDRIPIDLITEILSRLPANSISRCHCVSKLWYSILHRPYFSELFLTKSLVRPQVLFMCKQRGELFFYSSPLPQNPDEKSSRVIANSRMKFEIGAHYAQHCRGLVCFIVKRILPNKRKEMVPVICNPSTGRSLTLPKVKTRRVGVSCYLGYDPIEKQYKLLSMTCPVRGSSKVFEEHQILTLGTRNMSWRKIGCCIPHYSDDNGICINGVLYYLARDDINSSDMIVCFDIRSEKFSVVKLAKKVGFGPLVNYNGKLGLLKSKWFGPVNGYHTSFKLWVLEDAENQEWSKSKFTLPSLWKKVVGNDSLRFVGVTRTNEIVLWPYWWETASFYYFYYNIERNTVRKVGIQGMEDFYDDEVYIFLDHVENVALMEEL